MNEDYKVICDDITKHIEEAGKNMVFDEKENSVTVQIPTPIQYVQGTFVLEDEDIIKHWKEENTNSEIKKQWMISLTNLSGTKTLEIMGNVTDETHLYFDDIDFKRAQIYWKLR